MSMLVVLLACLACAAHGRRVQTLIQQLPGSVAENQEHGSQEMGTDSRGALLLASNPALIGSVGVHDSLSTPRIGRTLNHEHRTIDRKLSQEYRTLPPKFVQTSRDLKSSSVETPSILPQPLARACLTVAIFAWFWSTLPVITKSMSTVNRTPVPVMGIDDAKPSGAASVSSSIVNLSKNIVGSGALALSFGIAAFTASPAGVLPALAILVALGGLSAYSFAIVARVADEVGATSYQGIWAKVFGEFSSIIVAISVIFKAACSNLAYAIILGDSLSSIASLAGLPVVLCKPNTWIIGLSGLVLLPLSLMRNLSALAIGSVIGTIGTIYTALFMCLRLLDSSYAVGGKFHSLIPASSQPFFSAPSASNPLINSSIFVLVSMLSSAFLAHFNAPKFYQELAIPADGSSKQKAFNKVVVGAFGLAAILCSVLMVSGFLTFGGACQGLILNSYATSDSLAFLARLGICTSVIFSYPIIFLGLRDGVINMLKLDGRNEKTHVLSTILLLCAVNGLGLVVKNMGLVIAIAGAILGSALVYIFPAMMFIQATRMKRKALEDADEKLPVGRLREMYANYGLAGLGVVFAVIGVKMTLKSAGF